MPGKKKRKKMGDLQCSKSGHTLEANAQAIVGNVCTVANYPSYSDSFAQLRGLGGRKTPALLVSTRTTSLILPQTIGGESEQECMWPSKQDRFMRTPTILG